MIEQRSVLLEVIAITEDDAYPYTLLLQLVSKYYAGLWPARLVSYNHFYSAKVCVCMRVCVCVCTPPRP